MRKLLIFFGLLLTLGLWGQGINVMHPVIRPATSGGGGEEPSVDTEFRTYIFSSPTSTGNTDFQIPSWTSTPKAAKFVIVGTDASGDGYDTDNSIGVGFTDGTRDRVSCSFAEDGISLNPGVTSVAKTQSNTLSIMLIATDASTVVGGVFVSWLEGGVRINFTTVAAAQYKIIATFFAGDDVSAYVDDASPGDHVESVGFESNIIFTSCSGTTAGTSSTGSYTSSIGVATWDGETLKQGSIGVQWLDNSIFTNADFYCGNATVSQQTFSGANTWNSAISDVDADGFNFSDSNADEINYLALSIGTDADMGVVTVPTSGNISITTPGWQPQMLGFLLSNHTSVNTVVTNISASFGVGEVDATSEHSLSVTGKDGENTLNVHTSVRNTNALHAENYEQTVLYSGDVDAFTEDGFDITIATNPASEMYYIWYAIQ